MAYLPTVVLAKPNGDEIDRTIGFMYTDTFIDTVEGYHKGIGTFATMLMNESKMESDLDFTYALATKFFERRRWDDADERFASIIKLDSLNADEMAAEAQLKRALIASRQENYALAEAFCTALTKRWPQSEHLADATVYMGYFAQQDERPNDALVAFKRYIEQWPGGEDADWVTKQIKKIESPEEESE